MYFPVKLFTYTALGQVGSNITLDPHSPKKAIGPLTPLLIAAVPSCGR